jgi:hypothetical protein
MSVASYTITCRGDNNMKQRFIRLALILLIGSLLGGCAVGNKYMIADIQPQFEATGNYSVVVASLDQRKFIG